MGSWGGPDSLDADDDGDGWLISQGVRDDGDAEVYPGATDDWYDGVDGDCDGADDFDQDLDGWRHEDSGDEVFDCDDSDAEVHPEAVETVGDGVDSDCDGLDPEPVDTGSVDTGDTGSLEAEDTGAARTVPDGADFSCRGCAGGGVGWWVVGLLAVWRRRG